MAQSPFNSLPTNHYQHQRRSNAPRYRYLGENEAGEVDFFDYRQQKPVRLPILRLINAKNYIKEFTTNDGIILGMIASDYQAKLAAEQIKSHKTTRHSRLC